MIVYDLECRAAKHRFEGWFKSSDDYARQQDRSFVTCPYCGSTQIDKAVQAPRLARKGNQLPEVSRVTPSTTQPQMAAEQRVQPAAGAPLPAQAVQMMEALVTMQAEALKSSRYVGESFAEDARAMHYGEREVETIHGRATLDEAKELLEEGIGLMPLAFPVLPPDQAN